MWVPPWQISPPLAEETYTVEDALVVGRMLKTLLGHAARVKIACVAQPVNAIGPITTQMGAGVWPRRRTGRSGAPRAMAMAWQ